MAAGRPRKRTPARKWAERQTEWPRPPQLGVEQACRRYERKLKMGRATTRFDGNQALQVEHYRRRREQARQLEDAVRSILERGGLPRIIYASYYGFAYHVARVCRQYQHATRDELVNVALVRWTMLGLLGPVLEEIAGLVRTRVQPEGPGLADAAG